MSTCSNWVTTVEIECKNLGSMLDYECTSWADDGSDQSTQWADDGSNQCSSWQECHGYTPWDCIAGFFCSAYYWVAKWVCKVLAWVEVHIVCGLILWPLVLFQHERQPGLGKVPGLRRLRLTDQ
jgi:phospholipase C